jgi:exodeoxyribonuclease VII small subunit
MKKKESATITYEAAWQELQSIQARLEAGTVSIDTLASEVERAQELLQHCRIMLHNSKAIIDQFEQPTETDTAD